MRKWIFILIGLVVVAAVVGLVGFPRQAQRVLGVSQTNPTSGQQTATVERGNLTVNVGATGSVSSNQSAIINWQTSGQVANVLVSKGQKVSKGETLANLDPTSLPATVITAQANLVTAQTNLQNVLDNSSARASAEVALAQAQKTLQDTQKATQSKLFQNAGPNTIDIARANLITAQQAVDNATKIYNMNAGRSQDDVQYANALAGLANARQKLLTAEYNLNYVMGLPNPLDVQTQYAQLDQAQANLLTAKQNWDKVKNGPNPSDVASAQAQVAAAQATVDLAHLSAPFAGTITIVNTKPGDLVSPATAAFQIDDLSKLLVSLQVSEVDINKVKVGQPVSLTFDAIPNNTYNGVVTDIASVGTTNNGTVNFTVQVQVTNPDVQVKPGMTAAANIAVTQLTNVLLVPSRAVRNVNNQWEVYVVRGNGQVVPVVIQLGATDNVNSQVLSGNLQAGDKILLNPTSTSGSSSSGGGGFRFFGGGNRSGGSNNPAPSSNPNNSGGSSSGGG